MRPITHVIVLGGGSAGFMAALTLKLKAPHLAVRVIHSSDLGIIGVGEGSTAALTRFLHEYLRVSPAKFFEVARPTFKLGLKFIWGPRENPFHYTFGNGLATYAPGLPRPVGYYCDGDDPDAAMTYQDLHGALMARDKAFERGPGGAPVLHPSISYHFENEKFVRFLHDAAQSLGVAIQDDKVVDIAQDEQGVRALRLASGQTAEADLFVDASGFASVLLGKAMAEPFVSYASSLFNDRAVVGGWNRSVHEVIKPYTTCETMNAGWCWQIEHEARINRGYVYASAFISDEEAEREFRSKNPKVGPTRVVRFVCGRYQRSWVKNVVAVGNSSGFVEPLEATALAVIAMQCRLLADILGECRGRPLNEPLRRCANEFHQRNWDAIRRFIAVHYKFNARLDTPYWAHCRAATDLAGAEEVVDFYRANGPNVLAQDILLDKFDQFGLAGYYAMLVGQRVPHDAPHTPTPEERAAWDQRASRMSGVAERAMGVAETLAAIRSPGWKWQAPSAGPGPRQAAQS